MIQLLRARKFLQLFGDRILYLCIDIVFLGADPAWPSRNLEILYVISKFDEKFRVHICCRESTGVRLGTA